MDKHKRSLRRHHLARMKKKARKVYPHDPLARSANHLKVCSCWMCGHARKNFGPKHSERRALKAKDIQE